MTLPPLPEPRYPAARVGLNNAHMVWTAEEMKDYATAAVLAERDACAAIAERPARTALTDEGVQISAWIARHIRARKD